MAPTLETAKDLSSNFKKETRKTKLNFQQRRRTDILEILPQYADMHKNPYIRIRIKQEAQLMLTTGSTRLAVSRGQQTWYHSTCYI